MLERNPLALRRTGGSENPKIASARLLSALRRTGGSEIQHRHQREEVLALRRTGGSESTQSLLRFRE